MGGRSANSNIRSNTEQTRLNSMTDAEYVTRVLETTSQQAPNYLGRDYFRQVVESGNVDTIQSIRDTWATQMDLVRESRDNAARDAQGVFSNFTQASMNAYNEYARQYNELSIAVSVADVILKRLRRS